jgi:hypothetical protein
MKEKLITVTCPPCMVCNRRSHLRVPVSGFIKRMDGEATQVAFPHMPADQREMLISGTHPVCWDMMMAELQEEDA